MDLIKTEGTAVKRRRLTMVELAEILNGVTQPQQNVPLNASTHLKNIMSLPANARNYFSKSAALGAPEKILTLVAQYPEWGAKKLADFLKVEEICLSRQSIHKFLAKHNLNRRSLRTSWKHNLKETES